MATKPGTCAAGSPTAPARCRPDEKIMGLRPNGETSRYGGAGGKHTLRVLVADDNRDTADSLATLVRLWGHDVWVAYSGAAALEVAAADRPDVLLLDLAMPGMDGCELVRLLRCHDAPDCPLMVAVTGYADEAHHRLGLAAGFDQYLVKPVEPTTLERLLSREQGRRAAVPAAAAPAPLSHGILVVDDDAGVRSVLDVVLRQRGFVVWSAIDGLDALDQYGRHRAAVALVLLDVRMPGPDGPQTLGALRQLNPAVRCCFMSGDLGRYTEQELYALGAVYVFTKPFPLVETAQILWQMANAPPVSLC